MRNPDVTFAWDDRPGMNVGHIAAHELTTSTWESVYHDAPDHDHDKDDPELWVAEGRHSGQLYRIVYLVLDGTVVMPILIQPITGFPIHRRGLRR